MNDVDVSTEKAGIAIMHQIMSCNLSENFTMRMCEIKKERKAFMLTTTFNFIMDVLISCRDFHGADVEALWKSVDIFLRNKKYEGMHGRHGLEKRKANNNDDL